MGTTDLGLKISREGKSVLEQALFNKNRGLDISVEKDMSTTLGGFKLALILHRFILCYTTPFVTSPKLGWGGEGYRAVQ